MKRYWTTLSDLENLPAFVALCGISVFAMWVNWRSMRRHATADIFLLIGFLMPCLMFIGIFCCCTINVPLWDDYGAILHYLSIPFPERLRHMLDQHNEHRIFTARLVFEGIYAVLGRFNFRVCIAIGNLFLFCYVALFTVMFRRLGRIGLCAMIPCCWLMFSLQNYENSCWAMASVSNYTVLLFAFVACLLFQRRNKGVCFSLMLLSAFLCSFSTGAGVTIWLCLLGMFFCEPVTKSGTWRNFPRQVFVALGNKTNFTQLTCVGLAGGISTLLYFYQYTVPVHVGDDPLVKITVLSTITYFLSFLGAWIPLASIAIGVGGATCVGIGWIVYRLPRIKNIAFLGHFVFLTGGMLACAILRPGIAGPFSLRYAILSISALTSLVYLFLETTPLPNKIFLNLVLGLTGYAVAFSLFLVITVGPRLCQRYDNIRRNLLMWPESTQGLFVHDSERDAASRILLKCRQKGVYDPEWVRKKGEPIPREPLKM
jgi:hypothetical protein